MAGLAHHQQLGQFITTVDHRADVVRFQRHVSGTAHLAVVLGPFDCLGA
jgi:hypothetical protein